MSDFPPLTVAEVEHIERRLAEGREKARQQLDEMTDEESARLTAAAEADPDNPPQRDGAVMRPFYQVHPEFMAKWLRTRRGRPPSEAPKKQVTLRLDQDVIEHFRAGGPGWQSRINEALRRAAGK